MLLCPRLSVREPAFISDITGQAVDRRIPSQHSTMSNVVANRVDTGFASRFFLAKLEQFALPRAPAARFSSRKTPFSAWRERVCHIASCSRPDSNHFSVGLPHFLLAGASVFQFKTCCAVRWECKPLSSRSEFNEERFGNVRRAKTCICGTRAYAWRCFSFNSVSVAASWRKKKTPHFREVRRSENPLSVTRIRVADQRTARIFCRNSRFVSNLPRVRIS